MISKTIKQIFDLAIMSDARKFTKYLSKDCTVKVSRRFKVDKRDTRQSFVVSFGKPNYAERKFIKSCLKAKEPFPVKKIQTKTFPVRSA